MIERALAEPVVQYLRALTYNGELNSHEVWDLAHWLNQQPEKVLQSWPATELVKALRTAFADNKVTEQELEDLAHTIIAIEELWIESYPDLEETTELSAATALIEETKPTAPSLTIIAEMPDELRSQTFTVDLQHHTCTCPDWVENREDFPEGDYRRCCAHIARAFQSLTHTNADLRHDPLFIAFMEDHGRRNKGTEIDHVWRSIVINGTRVLYGASPTSEWVAVFAPAGNGYKRYGYNRRKKRWAFNDRPSDVAWSISSIFSQTQPQVLTPRTLAATA
jgi:hypothetical protein